MINWITKLIFQKNNNIQIDIIELQNLVNIHKQFLIKPHRTNFYHIFLFENCQPTHFVDFEPIKIEPYSLLFIDKDRVHKFDQLLKYEWQLLIFTEDFFCTTENDTTFLKSSILFNDLGNKPTINLNKKAFEKYIKICESITEELSLPNSNSKHILLKNMLHNFLLLSEREKENQDFFEKKRWEDLDYTLLFRDFLEKKFTKLKNVNDYAKLIVISEKHLRQATSKVLGKSPKEIINERILLEAKRLLVYTNLSIKEIWSHLGFRDPSYFVRYFKKNIHFTPTDFQKQYK